MLPAKNCPVAVTFRFYRAGCNLLLGRLFGGWAITRLRPLRGSSRVSRRQPPSGESIRTAKIRKSPELGYIVSYIIYVCVKRRWRTLWNNAEGVSEIKLYIYHITNAMRKTKLEVHSAHSSIARVFVETCRRGIELFFLLVKMLRHETIPSVIYLACTIISSILLNDSILGTWFFWYVSKLEHLLFILSARKHMLIIYLL